MYGENINEIELVMHRVSSHTSKSTDAYLAKKVSEIKIKISHLFEKSFDASPMDFYACIY